jgi:3-dehydroquinate synthase
MADAAVGGKTGIDLAEIKNFAGAFYPANAVFMAHDTLKTLPERELASGFAEIIKTAVLYGGETELLGTPFSALRNYDIFAPLISRVVAYKGAITGEDPEERGGKRFLLNLGHTFGHALESAAGLGALTHGEAVAWGMVRAVELGCRLGITPSARAGEITAIIEQNGFITTPRHPALKNEAVFWNAMLHDKKKMKGQLRFVIPNDHSAEVTTIPENEVRTVLQ